MKYVKTNDGNISAFVEGKSHLITTEHRHYGQLYECLKNQDLDGFKLNLTDQTSLNNFCEGYVSFDNGMPLWDGVPMPDLFTDRILDLVSQGESFGPMINFTANLAENEDDHSILELVDFLRNKYLPVTNDGCFLGYKVVKPNYRDIFTGKHDNSPGQEVKCKRSQVDRNRDEECSNGFHVGALDYVKTYGDWHGGVDLDDIANSYNKVVIVKVNPRDVVTVPRDHNFQKLRCCGYKVIADYIRPLDEAVYDDTVFFKADVVQERPAGWVSLLRDKFARIADLMKRAK